MPVQMGLAPAELNTQPHPVILLTALPDLGSAEVMADALVASRLAACVNIIPEMRSVYFWENKIVRESEVKLFVKTSSKAATDAIAFIKERHPYSVPEITTIASDMHADYWAWLNAYVG